MIAGIQRIPLQVHADERGWFASCGGTAFFRRPMVQTNLSFSRAGVIRGLHFHERGQDDLFTCLRGTARIVVLDRETGETFTEDIGDSNPVAIYVPGRHAHGFEALTDVLFCYHVTAEYDPSDPDEHTVPWNDDRGRAPVERDRSDPVRARLDRHVLSSVVITGADGQLGRALQEAFADRDVRALTRADWDVTYPASADQVKGDVELVLHTAAWTDVDGAEADPQGASRRECRRDSPRGRPRRTARRVLHRLRVRRSDARAVCRVRCAQPLVCLRTLEAARRSGRRYRCLDRADVMAVRPDGPQLRSNHAPPRGRP